MAYTNEMANAIRGIKNPTPLPVDVSVKGEMIYLLINRQGYERLEKNQQADFNAYLRDVKGVIRLGGGGDAQVVVL